MGVDKDHENKKRVHYGRRKAKAVDVGTVEAEMIDKEVRDNVIALNRESARPVEGYEPLFKKLHKDHPITPRY
ncbi:MAG: hypothetical protein ACEQSC_00470 [Candidatus Nanopelagicaceae bacterium]